MSHLLRHLGIIICCDGIRAWYATIVNEGYKYNGNDLVQQPVNFYPLYPLIAKALTIFPGHRRLSLLFLLLPMLPPSSACSCYSNMSDRIMETRSPYLTIAFFSFFPTSLFLSAGYTELLTLLLILCCFMLLRSGAIYPRCGFRRLGIGNTLDRNSCCCR